MVATAPQSASTIAASNAATQLVRPSPPAMKMENDKRVIRGQQRYKFFKRPVVPYLPQDVVMNAVSSDIEGGLSSMAHPVTNATSAAMAHGTNTATASGMMSEGGNAAIGMNGNEGGEEDVLTMKKSVAVQTIYRESQTQTDPYTADYITTPGQADPEVLSIAHLTYGNGLPAGLEEIQLIQRLREKRAFEESLPVATDEASLALRKQKLEEREHAEWAAREEDLKQEQQARLQVLIDALKARHDKENMLNEERINLVRTQAMQKRDAALESIHKERLKGQRALLRARQPQSKGVKRDIISETADFGSSLYAPIARDGKLPLKNQVVDYGIPLLNNYRQLTALEQNLSTPALKQPVTEVAVPSSQEVIKKDRETQRVEADLEHMDRVMSGESGMKKEKKVINMYRRYEPIVRPPTPTVQVPEADELSRAVLLLQRLLRGRAVQNAMHVSKAKHLPLIVELRLEEADTQAAADAQAEEEAAKKESDMIQGALECIQGQVMSEAFDFLSKEVVRLQEEKDIANFVEKARESRRIREAEEAGRRQAEYLLRKKKEHLLREMTGVHKTTADTLLDTLFDEVVDELACETALEHKAVVAGVAVDMIDALESKQGIVPGEESEVKDAEKSNTTTATGTLNKENTQKTQAIVREVLSSFVIPEVARQRAEAQKEVHDRRLLTSAHAAVVVAFNDVLTQQQGAGRMTIPVPLPDHQQRQTQTTASSTSSTYLPPTVIQTHQGHGLVQTPHVRQLKQRMNSDSKG